MSVFTPVTPDQLSVWLAHYRLGTLVRMQGIAAGIENTNYFVTTTGGNFVLTLFEKLTPAELPFYLGLMAHLAQHGIPCPKPAADTDDRMFSELNGKPAALMSRLPGSAVAAPAPAHCGEVGSVLAELHLAGQSYAGTLENPRGPRWWREAARQVNPFLDAERAASLRAELEFQALHRRDHLPRGAIHADLFRDNVLFAGEKVGGVIDFYFAGVDCLLFDVAVTLNDWCVNAGGEIDAARAHSLLAAYHARRPFTATERGAWPVILRAAALRFWLSRLYDFYLPRPGKLVHAHDPEHFRRILELRIAHAGDAPWV
ncbi:MAG: homoserine kinase [Betaproteobacteria bacterium]|nr:MAG: homoserine kinase [Betaproteobacteria bacterium]